MGRGSVVDRERHEGVVIERRRCLFRKGRERTFEEGVWLTGIGMRVS